MCIGAWQNNDGAKAYDSTIAGQCRSAGGTFVPITDIFVDPTNRGSAGRSVFGGVSDDFHPNDRGHRSIADNVLAALAVSPNR